MNTRWFGFSACTLCLHVALFWVLGQNASFNHGAAGGVGSTEAAMPVLTVGFVKNETVRTSEHEQIRTGNAFVLDHNNPVEKYSNPSPSQTIEKADPPSPELRSELTPAMATAQDYFPAGHLTRLPAPLSEIDLDIPAVNNIGITGKIDLIILIDANGIVADVISLANAEHLRAFSDRVASRFKNTRFAPGEIDGVAVKSQLQITVVSEKLSPAEI
jgi:hypothetical protein